MTDRQITNLHTARVEAAARVLPCFWSIPKEGHPAHKLCVRCRERARAAIAAADAVVSVEQVAEEVKKADAKWQMDERTADTADPRTHSQAIAAAIHRMYRGEETGND